VREGAAADLVVFDPQTIIDRATYENPNEPADGVELVIVNGKMAWRGGAPGEERTGRFLARSQTG
jgi:N-acyl-D-aspartate/D-glutamate deacylase